MNYTPAVTLFLKQHGGGVSFEDCIRLACQLEDELITMTAARDKLWRLAVAEHDWRRGYGGPCPPNLQCATCRTIRELEEVGDAVETVST